LGGAAPKRDCFLTDMPSEPKPESAIVVQKTYDLLLWLVKLLGLRADAWIRPYCDFAQRKPMTRELVEAWSRLRVVVVTWPLSDL
jgi:hypothetical protein